MEALRGELAALGTRALEAQRAADALEPLVAVAAAGAGGMAAGEPSVADTAARVARMKAALQAVRGGVRRLDVRVGMAQRSLLFGWRHGGRAEGEEAGGDGSLFVLRGSRDSGPAEGDEEDDDDEEE